MPRARSATATQETKKERGATRLEVFAYWQAAGSPGVYDAVGVRVATAGAIAFGTTSM